MTDQADGLRRLLRVSPTPDDPTSSRRSGPTGTCRTLLFTSGKGGVGTSNLVLNLAIALAESDLRIVLVDADLGLANLELLCGLAPARDLGDVLAGEATLDEAIVGGPSGLRLVAGAHGMRAQAEALTDGPTRLASEIAELEAGADYLLIDAGSGLGPGIAAIAEAADEVVVVTTPEPTSVADAHAALGRLRGGPTLRLVVNQADSRREADDCLTRIRAAGRQFHGITVRPLGHVRADPRVGRAVKRRRPLLVEYPNALASRDLRRLARTLIEERQPRNRGPGVLAALAGRMARARPPTPIASAP